MTKQWGLTCLFSKEALVYIVYTLVYSVQCLDPEQNTYSEISRNIEQIGLECKTLFLYLRILPKDMNYNTLGRSKRNGHIDWKGSS